MSSAKELQFLDDPKYRSYASQVEKVLKNFEYSTEWADLISALVKLNKVLQANSSYEFLPKRITIAKRLSQCLHPALPGGVHIKALDVYDTIFKNIGPKNLEMDLCIYGAGIFSLLVNASMQVRPVLLNVYETHLLPLGEKLRTGLDGLILGILPGLEEGSEHFDRITLLLDKIAKSVGLQVFYSSIWRCVLSSPSGSIVRLAAMQLVLRRFDKKKMTDDQLYLIGLDVDMMVQGVCEALQDENVLTQRATLDVLTVCFPLSSLPVSRSDAQTILSSAVYILLRRDMSLNRRLYSWVLGVDMNKGISKGGTNAKKSVVEFFETNSKTILVDALLDIIGRLVESFVSCCCGVSLQLVVGNEVKFIRMLISLLDRSEVGTVIINSIFSSVLRFIQSITESYRSASYPKGLCCKSCTLTPKVKENCSMGNAEFIKSVNLFVSSFETDFIWGFVGEKFESACPSRGTSESGIGADKDGSILSYFELCNIVHTLLHIVTLETYVEIQTVCLPDLLNCIFAALSKSCSLLSAKHLQAGLALCLEILKHVQPFQPSDVDNRNENKHSIESCADSFKRFLISLISEKIVEDASKLEYFMVSFIGKSDKNGYPTGSEMLPKYPKTRNGAERIRFRSHREDNEVMLQVFKDSCKILVDICCFPMLRRGHPAPLHLVPDERSKSDSMPEWLVFLVACACCSEDMIYSPLHGDFGGILFFSNISITACSTVLELMALTASNVDVGEADQVVKTPSSSDNAVISVVVPPPLSSSHLTKLHRETEFYEQMCLILWSKLNESSVVSSSWKLHPVCARLLLLLHQLCPDETVERLLMEDILSVDQRSRVAALKKFTKLWHYMRDCVPHSQIKGRKTFSRCLFAVLDQLMIDRYSHFPDLTYLTSASGQAIVSTTVSTWLRHVLEEGDVCRILEPYILILLHSGTHRKSLRSLLQLRKDHSNEGIGSDRYDLFLQIISERASPGCTDCFELRHENKEEITSLANFHNFSTESSLTYTLCEVHQQMAKEKHRYKHLVALLTLSEELEADIRLEGSDSQTDLHSWVVGFVDMVIQQGISIYKTQLSNTLPFTESEGFSDDTLLSPQQVGLEASENIYSSDDSIVSQATEAIELNQSFSKSKNPLFEHILVYQENFDSSRVLYSLQGILNILLAHPDVFIRSACSTSLASSESAHSSLVQELLVRHERTIQRGSSFYEPTSPVARGATKNRMLIEVLISICLYYMRSAFQSSQRTSNECSDLNHEVQCFAATLLRHIIKELTVLAQQDRATPLSTSSKFSPSTKQFSAYVVSVLQKHQVQSSVLTCLLMTIFTIKDPQNLQQDSSTSISGNDTSHSEITDVDRGSDNIFKQYVGGNLLHATTLFSHLLGLTFDIVKLEHFAFSTAVEITPKESPPSQLAANVMKKKGSNGTKNPKMKRRKRIISHLLSVSHQYETDLPLAAQKVFLSALLEIYKLENFFNLHQECSTLLRSILPHLGGALTEVVVPVILHQCLNLENTATQVQSPSTIPPDYIEATIKNIAALSHYCLFGESSGNAEGGQSDVMSLAATKASQLNPGGSSIGSGLSTLLNVFNPSGGTKAPNLKFDEDWSDGLANGRVAVLKNLARITSCMCLLWRWMVREGDGALVMAEKSKAISYNILQLLGPIAMQYGEYLLVGLALVWQNRDQGSKSQSPNGKTCKSLVEPNEELEYIINVMMAIKLLSIEMLFSLVKQVLKSPPPITSEVSNVMLHESILQILLFYMRQQKPATLADNWLGFSGVLQETLTLGAAQPAANATNWTNPVSPNCYFLLLYLLSDYVKHASSFTLKKEQRELQEAAGRCIDACNVIAGSSLEQSTWMRRNVSVLPGPQAPEGAFKTHRKTESQSSIDLMESLHGNKPPIEIPIQTSSSDTLLPSSTIKPEIEVRAVDDSVLLERERPTSLPTVTKSSLNPINFRNSVKALTVLSEVVANLLDVIYNSDEKDKMVPVLTSIMNNVTPYLRNHSADNVPSFCSCVTFLASISGFQHTRRAWRRDVLELFLDPPFFHMPLECVDGWRTVIDNLMTHDKTTFKEIMSRMSMSRSGPSTGSLNIFSNKEQELELRALHIKRLAFILFSSEMDQYQKQLPEVQERLVESLRFHNVPGVQCRVFLCFRVLLLRISPYSLTSLWPTIFTELVHVMLQLEQALDPSFTENNIGQKSKSKSSRNNSPTTPQGPRTVMTCWLDMYLSACKLLDLLLCLPVQYVPQFQLYRWSFVGEGPVEPQRLSPPPQYRPNGPSNQYAARDLLEEEKPDPTFVPHCLRIQKLYSNLYPKNANRLLPTVRQKPMITIGRLKSIEQLQLFFNTITSPFHLFNSQTSSVGCKSPFKRSDSEDSARSLPHIERAMQKDFVRPMLSNN